MSFSSPGDLPNPGIEPGCPALHTHSLLSEPPEKALLKILDTYFSEPQIF